MNNRLRSVTFAFHWPLGRIANAIVERDRSRFARSILKWAVMSVPATFTNAMLRYLEGTMSLAFRRRLVTLAHRKYMSNEVYYQVLIAHF